jgi:hypothetical protein
MMSKKVQSNERKIFPMERITVNSAQEMARYLVNSELRGWGDTQEAATHRLSVKYRVKPSLVRRLVYGEVKDMLLSNFAAIASAYQAACSKVEANIEHEKATHEHYSIANSVAGLAIRQKEETE